MIKRSYVIIAIVIYFIFTSTIVTAALLSPFISKLAPAAALATGTGGGFTIPAKVLAKTSTGANVAKWVSLAVPGTTAAKVAAVVLTVSGGLAADYLMLKGAAWFAANKITKNYDTDELEKTDTVPVPNGYTAEDYIGTGTLWNGSPLIKHGIYGSTSLASAALNDWIAESCPNCGPTNVTKVVEDGTRAWYAVDRSNGTYHYFYFASAASHYEDRKVPIPVLTVENKLESDLAAEDSNAKEVAKAALEVAANAMDNPSHPVTTNVNAYNTINNYLTQNLTANQLTNLEASATPNVGDQVLPDTDEAKADTLTAAQIAAAVQAALANQGLSASQIAAAIAAAQSAATGGLTQAELASTLSSEGLTAAQIAAAVAAANPAITQTQVKTAVKEAIDDETGVTPPADPTIVLPDKLSLTTVMNDFWTSVQALPIFNVLNGITINTSGSSNLCINLPSAYGGQRCYNAANIQDELNMIGSVILGLTTVISFIGVFKG